MVHRLEQLEEATVGMTVTQMAHHLVELMACFVNDPVKLLSNNGRANFKTGHTPLRSDVAWPVSYWFY